MSKQKYRFLVDGWRSLNKEELKTTFKQIKPIWCQTTKKQKLLLLLTGALVVSPLDDLVMIATGPLALTDEAVMSLLSLFTLFAVRKSQGYIDSQLLLAQTNSLGGSVSAAPPIS